MTLTEKEFNVLDYLRKQNSKKVSQRQIVEKLHYSLGTVNSVLKDLKSSGLIDEHYRIKEKGLDALLPYKVTNAVIMAAGVSSRYEPLFNDKPKGLMVVKGEVLIERQIKQLIEAGIEEIYLVVGFKKELFFYLEEKYGVHILVNSDYALRNNNGTIYFVRNYLDNSYICSSDDYFVENPFELYNYTSYYSAEFMQGKTGERGVILDSHDRIIGTYPGAHNSWGLIGHSYWDREFSKAFIQKLSTIYDDAETKPLLWERIFDKYIAELPPMYLKKYKHVIYEFDNLNELRSFDPFFVINLDEDIINNLCHLFKCDQSDLHHFDILEVGKANNLFTFECKDEKYIYRNCSPLLKRIVDRKREAQIQKLVSKVGIDNTVIYINPKDGWKVSRFIDLNKNDIFSRNSLEEIVKVVKKLHEEGSPYNYDFKKEIRKLHRLLDGVSDVYENFSKELADGISLLQGYVDKDNWPKCLCHNNIAVSTIIRDEQAISLIDWETAGMNDPGYDIAGMAIEENNVTKVLDLYFDHPATFEEERHVYACAAILEYYRMILAIYLEINGRNLQDQMYYWYKSAKKYKKIALEMYGETN
ncbi:NTP transferase domain-containing protein [Lactobacillus delbrueckii subsp. lactis]|uniref:NTP transferase domain-containing protein n=1 Tax=Lactobacillus delbrueckii TaxID=1584 RepID=UPI001E32B02C|nr:NTP transferase domain-containing protein [Lactobacillus delbrueckii]MCD5598266.1 NTP transferase domain-containing protein [Lactobacillus delbrueckii subsp. lactis]